MIIKHVFTIIVLSYILFGTPLHAEEKWFSPPTTPPINSSRYKDAAGFLEAMREAERIHEAELEYMASLGITETFDSLSELMVLTEAPPYGYGFDKTRLHQAEATLREGLTILREAIHPEHEYILRILNYLGMVYMQQGAHDKAEEILKQIISTDVSLSDPRQDIVIDAIELLAFLYENLGRDDAAATQIKEHAQRLAQLRTTLLSFGYARYAVYRNDYEAAYRIVEDLLLSEFPEIRKGAKQYLNEYPEALQHAKQTFTADSFTRTKSEHGDRAFDIEKERLAAYKVIASKKDYVQAENTFRRFFRSQLDK